MGARVSYEAVLCDVDGVVRHWGNSMSEVDAQFGLASGTLASIAFDPVRLTPAITGAVSDEAWRTAVADELGRTCGDKQNGRDAVATWSAMTGSVDGDVVELLRAARDHTRVVLVSNATTRLEHDMAALGVLDAVDDVVNSSSVGVAKPDEKIYRVAAERAWHVGRALCLRRRRSR